jgi:hypothetical protein
MDPKTLIPTPHENEAGADESFSFSDVGEMDEDLSFRTLDSLSFHHQTTEKRKNPSTSFGQSASPSKPNTSGFSCDDYVLSWHSATASCSDLSSGTGCSFSETQDFDDFWAISSSAAATGSTVRIIPSASLASSEKVQRHDSYLYQGPFGKGSRKKYCVVSPNRHAINHVCQTARISPHPCLRLDPMPTLSEAPALKLIPDLHCAESIVVPNTTAPTSSLKMMSTIKKSPFSRLLDDQSLDKVSRRATSTEFVNCSQVLGQL